MRTIYLAIFSSFLIVGYFASLVSSLAFQTRRCSLFSWDGSAEVGTILERRSEGLHEVLIGKSDEIDNENEVVTVKLPYFKEASSVGSSLWPAGLAGSILFHSSTLQKLTKDKDVIEFGAGLGLGGLGIAKQARRCVITDNDEELVQVLGDCLSENDLGDHADTVEARKLDWRDSDPSIGTPNNDDKFDVCLGFDVAYYYHLLGPLVSTARLKLKDRNSFMLVVGQSNRECQWKFYHHIRDGGYNQLTDEHEKPWEGSTKMMLYKLKMGVWKDGETVIDDNGKFELDGIIPIAAILYSTPDLQIPELTQCDYIATQQDQDSQEMSF